MLAEELRGGRDLPIAAEHLFEPLAVAGRRMVARASRPGGRLPSLAPGTGPREQGRCDRGVVLAEADEDRRQDPADGHLGQKVFPPLLVRAVGSACCVSALVLPAHVRADLTNFVSPLPQVLYEII